MSKLTYEIVEHDGGWAYRAGEAFSETFRSHAEALAAANRAAGEQRLAGEQEEITYQDETGAVHDEIADGSDRPDTQVQDTAGGG